MDFYFKKFIYQYFKFSNLDKKLQKYKKTQLIIKSNISSANFGQKCM